jgi:UDP-glucose 4-epimerase
MTTHTNVVVTGGAGFIGANLVRELVRRGSSVAIVDTFVGGRFDDRLVAGVPVHEVDIRNERALTDVFAGASCVFHLAALPRVQDSIDHPRETHDVNVNGTLAVLEAARAAGVTRVVLASSAAVYGDQETVPLREDLPALPKSPYGLHKYIGERMLALWSDLYGLETVSLRFFNVYGPYFDPDGPYALVVGRFLKLRAEGKPLTIAGDGTHTRDYVHVRDIVEGLILAAERSSVGHGEVMNLASGAETSVLELAAHIGGATEPTPARIEPARSCGARERAHALLGWVPSVGLSEGIRELMDLS